MRVDGVDRRSIWLERDGWSVGVIDQTALPHQFLTARLRSLEDAADAIRSMRVRGAPLIGAMAAYGFCLALRANDSDAALDTAAATLAATRPTAVNLRHALERVAGAVRARPRGERVEAAYAAAAALCDGDVAINTAIGRHGLALLEGLAREKRAGDPVQVLTHCNAGWLATVDGGTALAPVYRAHDAGLPVHAWVSETRPRNQGAALTAWELGQHGVPYTVIADNAAGHLLQRGRVDICLVGADRVAANGDVANKVGTYLKALAAQEAQAPFYVAAPSPSIDWDTQDGAAIPIEERDPDEVTHVSGQDANGRVVRVRVTPADSLALNPGFDVTPARLVSGLITERGVCPASPSGLRGLFPEWGAHA